MAKKTSVQVGRNAAIALLVELGYKTATNFNDERLVKKFQQMAEKDMSEVECENKKLLDKIMSAIENKEDLEIIDDEEAAPAKKSKKDAKAEKSAKKSKKAEADDEDEDEEEEDEEDADEEDEESDDEDEDEEDEKPAKKPAKAKPKKGEKPAKPAAKAEKKPKGGGVIGGIVKRLLKASERKPVSKDGIVEYLTEEFPDRDPDSMRGTVNVQVPSRIQKERGIVVHKNDKGYWAEEGDGKPVKSDKKPAKAEKAKAGKKSKKDADEEE